MPRTPRSILVAGGETYHVIARGNNRMRIFHRKEDYASYYELLKGFSRSLGIAIHHYVLMPNHVHLLVKPKDSLSFFMQVVQSTYAKYFPSITSISATSGPAVTKASSSTRTHISSPAATTSR